MAAVKVILGEDVDHVLGQQAAIGLRAQVVGGAVEICSRGRDTGHQAVIHRHRSLDRLQRDEIRIAEEEEADRTYGALKKVIEKVAAGVKSGCYFEAEHGCYEWKNNLPEELNGFFIAKAEYNFNKWNTSSIKV